MKQLNKKYDVVILGSGMGGLACALILAKEGKTVCVLEKNAQIGGTLQTFKRDGGKFDTGVHYVGGLDEGQPLYPYFKYLDIFKDIDLLKMDEDAYDVISFDDDDNLYPHAQGYDNFVNQLLKYFPEEEKGLKKYVSEMRSICDQFSLYNIDSSSNKTLGSELDLMGTSAKETIEGFTKNKKLQQILSGSNLLYAGIADKSPFYMHALIINSYILSSYKFPKGGSQISRSLNYSIRDLGGDIVRSAEVTSINNQNGIVKSVTLKDGREIEGDLFISNIHPTETFNLVDQSQIRKSYLSRILNMENTTSVFTLYIVLKPKSVKYFNSNRYHFKTYDVWNAHELSTTAWGKYFAVFALPDNKDPEYADVITVMAYMKMDEVLPWAGTLNTTLDISDRGSGYEDFKEKKAEILFEECEKVIPGLKSKTQSYYTSTPLTQRDYLNTVDGGLYGIVKDFNAPLKSHIRAKTKIQNLFLTGQNIIMHGVLGATIGAVVTCEEILGKGYVVDKIKKVL